MSGLERSERYVHYTYTPNSWGGDDRLAAYRSDRLDEVRNPELRAALRLADIVRELGIIKPPHHHGFPVRVRVSGSSVETSFPDDIMPRLEQWHNENN